MNDLVTWLRGQFDRDQQTAQAMTHAIENLLSRWSPARLLADVEAKRRILAGHYPVDPCGTQDAAGRPAACQTVRLLTLPYVRHKGYREEWGPQ